jgi:hypothetical protein
MSTTKIDYSVLPIAVRVYPLIPEEEEEGKNKYSRLRWRSPKGMLVIDTETRTDATQRTGIENFEELFDQTSGAVNDVGRVH